MQDTAVWTYLWLTGGGLVLVLAALTFAYLVARRINWEGELMRHERWSRLDGFLSERAPGLWTFIRRRFTVRQWHGLALTAGMVVAFTTAYLFALITQEWTHEGKLYAFDQQVYEALVVSMNEPVTAFMRFMTHFGDSITIILVSVGLGILLIVRRYYWQVVSLLLVAGLGSGVMFGLKWFFERARPAEQLSSAAGHSFPSGHSFMSMALYGFLIFLTWRFTRNDALRVSASIVLALIIFLVGASRIVLRVHWASDVAGGFTLGLAWLACSLVIARALRAYKEA